MYFPSHPKNIRIIGVPDGTQYFRRPVRYDGACAATGKSIDKTVYLYTDGTHKGNPGANGWSVLLCCGTHEKRLFDGEAETTNNRTGLTTAIEGLKGLKYHYTMEICIDLQYVKNGMEGWVHGWKKNGWKTATKQPIKNGDLWKELSDLVRQYDIRWA